MADGTHSGCKSGRLLDEVAGACGDLGTLLPYALGAVTVAGMSAVGVFLGFGVFLVATGLIYGLPIAVQPMKALGAVILAGNLSPVETVFAAMTLGLILVVGALTGTIQVLARLIPRSVTAGLQLGLGAMMIFIAAGLMAGRPILGTALLALLLIMMATRRLPAALLLVLVGIAIGLRDGLPPAPEAVAPVPIDLIGSLSGVELWRVLGEGVLPQLGLTLTNAVVVTVAVAGDLFGPRAARVTERNLSLTTGVANLLLAPFGALPMCHGAGGLQAQYRFGARGGLAPVLLGLALIVLVLVAGVDAAHYLAVIPPETLGALLIVAGADLALTPRLFDARPDCRPAIALTALATVALNPAVGLALGWAWESGRSALNAARRRG